MTVEPPSIFRHFSYEEILSRMKEELIHCDRSFTALIESDPAMKILEVAAWNELVLRQRVNEAAKANLLCFATGNDLDYLAEFYEVERMKEEGDEAFRKRIKVKIVGWSPGGKEYYRYHALSSDIRVKDALVESLVPGSIQVSILSVDGVPSEELLNIVRKKVTQDDIRMLTDTVTVVSCNIIPVNIHAKITAVLEDTIEGGKKQFIEKFESAKRLGWNVTRSWIIANLFVEGVENIELIEPRENMIIQGNESTFLNSIEIELVKS